MLDELDGAAVFHGQIRLVLASDLGTSTVIRVPRRQRCQEEREGQYETKGIVG